MPPKTRAAAARKTNRRKVSKNIVAGQAHIKSTSTTPSSPSPIPLVQ